MGLGHSFSCFHRHCLHPCSHSSPPLCVSLNHTWAGPLVLFISCPSLHRLQISLSIFCHLSSSTHLALLSVSCPVCHTCAVIFCLPESHLYLLHLLPPLTLQFLLLSFMFTLFHLLSFKSSLLCSSLFQSKSFDMVYCHSMQFTANIFLMLEVYCNTTLKI